MHQLFGRQLGGVILPRPPSLPAFIEAHRKPQAIGDFLRRDRPQALAVMLDGIGRRLVGPE